MGDLGSSLGWEDPLEKEMATHSSIFARRISIERGAWLATVHRVAKSQTQLSDFHFHFPSLGIKPTSPVSPRLQTDSIPAEPSGKPVFSL